MKNIVYLFVSILLFSCSNRHDAAKHGPRLLINAAYFHDPRTDMCFVHDCNHSMLTYVPCTPEVRKAVADDEKLAFGSK